MTQTVLILSKDAEQYASLLAPYQLPGLNMVTAVSGAGAAGLIENCDIIFGAPGLIAPLLPQAAQLKWVQSTWAGVERLLAPEMRRNYTLTNVRGIFGELMAEYVLGYLLLYERKMLAHFAAQQIQQWLPVLPGTVRGKTMGILGVGSIGGAIAETAKHFGMQIYGYTRSSEGCVFIDRYFHEGQMLELVAEVDYLVCTLPHTAGNNHLIDAAVLGAMKPSAVLVNVGRGQAIDEQALVDALHNEQLALAVLDVFHEEPLPKSHFLWDVPNLLLTSHTAAPSFPAAIAPIFADNYVRFVEGRPLQYQVDFGRGY